MNSLQKKVWSPYVAGALTGLLLVFSVWVFSGYFGSTTTFSRVGSFCLDLAGVDLTKVQFFTDYDGLFSFHTLNNFQTTFVLGILIGAFFSSKLSGAFRLTAVPDRFATAIGEKPVVRAIVALIGGFVMIIGARIADGCTSWWGISASSKLDVAGFATVGMFFLFAAITAHLLYRGRSRIQHGRKS